MNAAGDSWLARVFGFSVVHPIISRAEEPEYRRSVLPRVMRVWLAVFLALSALLGLKMGLLFNRVALVDACVECVIQEQECEQPTPIVTKTVEPLDPDTGGVVTITFIITGVGPRSLDAVLLQDVSGSMGMGEAVTTTDPMARLEASKAAAWDFVEELRPSDWVAVVAYSTTARLVEPLTTTRGAISEAISGLQAYGWTNISDGIRIASAALLTTSARLSCTAKKAIVLLSDGNTNRPEPESTACGRALTEAQIAASQGISIFTIGFGQDANHDLLQSIAEVGGGEYYYAPTSNDLHAAYLSIALRLRNLAIVDTLPRNIEVDCPPFLPPYSCTEDLGGTTTVTWPISDDALLGGGPITVTFVVTVNWPPGEVGPINGSESCLRYDEPGEESKCDPFVNPPITVGGRMITGFVFADLDQDGHFGIDKGESGICGVVTTSNGLTYETDGSGFYMLRTSAEPTLTVAVRIPSDCTTTTSEITRVRPLSGVYSHDFGLYPLIDGVSLRLLSAEPHPGYHGDSTALQYSVTNRDGNREVVSGTIFVLDSLGRVLDTKGFTLDPGRSTVFSSPSVIVPQDIAITLTARATYDVLGGVTVGDEVTLTLCPEDIYERGLGNDSRPSVQCNRSLDPQLSAYAIPQLHDFSEADSDWLCFSTNATQTTHYVFVAHPLSPMGVAISLTVFDPQSDAHIHSRSNLGDITSDVRLNLLVGVNPGAPSPRVLDVQDYHLLVEPVTGQSGCWTDYELWVEEASWKVWLPVVMKDF